MNDLCLMINCETKQNLNQYIFQEITRQKKNQFTITLIRRPSYLGLIIWRPFYVFLNVATLQLLSKTSPRPDCRVTKKIFLQNHQYKKIIICLVFLLPGVFFLQLSAFLCSTSPYRQALRGHTIKNRIPPCCPKLYPIFQLYFSLQLL